MSGALRESLLFASLFVVALVARVVAVLYLNESYAHYLFAGDSTVYDGLARSLTSGAGYAIDGDYREYTRIAPVFPFYLAALYRFVGDSMLIVGLANAVVGSLTCLVVYAIGRNLLARWAAVAAALVSAVYWEFLFWTPFLLKETVALFLFALAVLLLVEAIDRHSWRVGLFAGAALGVAVLARYPHLLFVPFLAGALLLSPERRRLGRLIVPILAGVVLAMSPWLVRNYLVFGELLLSNHGPARALYLIHAPGKVADVKGYAGVEGVDMQRFVEKEERIESITAREQSHFRAFLARLAEDPSRIARLGAAKVFNMWRPTWQKFKFSARLPFTIEYLAVVAAGIAGLVLSGRARRWNLLHVVLLYYVVVHAVWWGEIRNRVYVMPYVIVFAAYAAQSAATRWGSMTQRCADRIRSRQPQPE